MANFCWKSISHVCFYRFLHRHMSDYAHTQLNWKTRVIKWGVVLWYNNKKPLYCFHLFIVWSKVRLPKRRIFHFRWGFVLMDNVNLIGLILVWACTKIKSISWRPMSHSLQSHLWDEHSLCYSIDQLLSVYTNHRARYEVLRSQDESLMLIFDILAICYHQNWTHERETAGPPFFLQCHRALQWKRKSSHSCDWGFLVFGPQWCGLQRVPNKFKSKRNQFWRKATWHHFAVAGHGSWQLKPVSSTDHSLVRTLTV